MGWEGMRGIVGERKASRRRTLGLGLARGVGRGTVVPRPWAGRPALEAWGSQPLAWPRLVEQPGRTQAEEPRQWHGHSVGRQVEGADSAGRVAQEPLRCVVGQASQRAQPHAPASAAAQAPAAKALVDHVRQGHARWCACEAEAEATLAASEPRGPGRRGRRPPAWRSQAVRSRVVAAPRHPRRARRGRPATAAPPPREAGERLVVAVEALAHPEADHGWPGLVTTGSAERGTDVEILQA